MTCEHVQKLFTVVAVKYILYSSKFKLTLKNSKSNE